jgi:hypothetical protein
MWLASEPSPSVPVSGRSRPVGAVFPIGEDAFATVRHGDVWFAIREHAAFRHGGDLRSDFGLLAAEYLVPGTGWTPLLAVRPHTANGMDAAGPVLRTGGRIGFPDAVGMRLDRKRRLILSGGWRDVSGRWLRRAAFRYETVGNGVALSFPARRGDHIEYSVFADRPSVVADGVVDERAHTTLTPGPLTVGLIGGFASSDSSSLTRAVMATDVAVAGRIKITVVHGG